jgi:trimeric autotransporter adhesin
MGRSPLRLALLLIPFVFACFGLLQNGQAVVPAPDGGYPGGNTAEGADALFSLTTGVENTAIGRQALRSNTTGNSNTANGFQALYKNTRGNSNTANGDFALQQNTIGVENTATGFLTLSRNTTGYGNTANGNAALGSNTTGVENTANGDFALDVNTTGDYNIALGYMAGSGITMGSNNIAIGSPGRSGDSYTIRIGVEGTQNATFIAGIAKAMVTGLAVYVDTTTGQLGILGSSERFKEDIKPMDKASEALLSLRPVTFRYKKNIDPSETAQFGLVAEEVEKVNPALVTRDSNGESYTVRYEAVNAMLLNEFLKEHRTVQEQKATIAQLKKDFAEQQKQIEALTTGLQKVSAQFAVASPSRGGLELSKFATGRVRRGGPAPQMVVENR